jgi:PAS domain S-box-containing protein
VLAEQNFSRLHQGILDGFVTVSMKGRIIEANQAYLTMLGYTHEELAGLTYQDLTPRRWHAFERDIVKRQVLVHGHSMLYEKEYIRKDGVVFPIELRTYLIRDAAGRPAGMWAFIRDITERKRAEAALQQAKHDLERQVRERTAQLRELTLELVRVERRERRRLARILHEDLQQTLAAVKYRISELVETCREPRHQKTATSALDELDQAIQVSRSLARDLRPPVLYELGLGAALDWLAQDLMQRFGLKVRLKQTHRAEPATDDLRLVAFEAVRELLLNVIKHAGVKDADVTLASGQEGALRIRVKDRGAGFDPASRHARTFGLLSIRERVEGLGGKLSLESAPGKGVCATLHLPHG